jgi:hypothetical protein
MQWLQKFKNYVIVVREFLPNGKHLSKFMNISRFNSCKILSTMPLKNEMQKHELIVNSRKSFSTSWNVNEPTFLHLAT